MLPIMADETPEAEENEVATESGSTNIKRVVVLVVGILIALVVLGGVAFWLMWPKTEAPKQAEEPAPAERIGPRSIMQGVSTLQEQQKSRTGRYTGNVYELWDGYKADPKGLSPALAEVIENAVNETNLHVRAIQNGFEIALRQDAKRWLVYTQAGSEAPKVSTQETDGPPPFAVAGTLKAATEVKIQELVEFKDPLGFFTIMMPGGFQLEDGSKGNTSRIMFSYDSGVRMTIKAMEVSREWDPEGELAVKAEQIQSKVVPAFAEFDLAVRNLLKVEGATGYEMGLVGINSKYGMQTHSFVFGGNRTTISIALISSAPDGKTLYDALVNSVRGTLQVEEGPSLASRRAARKAAAEEKKEVTAKPALTPEQLALWNEARSMLKTTGIMRSGDAFVALVNDRLLHVNETIIVSIKGKPYKFVVTSITVDQVDFEPVMASPSDEQDNVRM